MTDWVKIEGFPNYSISYEGQVRNDRRGRILKHIKRMGYASVNLSHKGRASKVSVHRLVARAFIPNPENLPLVNHKDENRSNPHGDNLEWIDYSGNLMYSCPTAYTIRKGGKEYYIHNMREFCKEHKVSSTSLYRIFNKEIESINGWYL